MKQEQKTRKILSRDCYFIIIVILLSISIITLTGKLVSQSKEIKLYQTILYADSEFSGVSLDSQKADSYYDEASYAYENRNYKLVESNCRLARDYFLRESQGYRKIKSFLIASEIKDKLIDIYVDASNEIMMATDSMYEACEHFETASRYYDKYFNMDVPYDDSSYEMGGQAIDMMSEKIKAHDEAVGNYNQLLEDFRIELEKRL